MTRFYIQDQGTFIPIGADAQVFAALNFTQINSLGLGTDTCIPVVNADNPYFIADIQNQDLWGFTGSGSNASIYRMTKVGINNNSPTADLDVTGTAHVTGDVDFDAKLNVDGDVTFTSSTQSVTKDTGALVITQGGLGVEGNTNIGGAVDINQTLNVDGNTTLNNTLEVTGATYLNSTLDVTGATYLNSTLDVTGATNLNNTLDVTGATNLNNTLDVTGATNLNNTLDVTGATNFNNTLDVTGATNLNNTLDVTGATNLNNTLDVTGATNLNNTLDVTGIASFTNTTQSTSKDTGAVTIKGGLGIGEKLNVGNDTKIEGTLELDKSLIDVNNSTATGKFDYRLSSVGTGVSWRPPGVQTQNAIWVTMDGNDSNSGFLEGDAKRTIGAAATVAQEGDTIFVRSGVYYENNPIGLRTDVSVSGQDLRLVTIIPQNPTKDVFHVRRGCLVENLSFAGVNVSVAHTGAGAIAFPPTPSDVSVGIGYSSVTGYLAPGPATEGSTGRWKSPYIRNCTNFMTKSIGMKINGDHATASTIGGDLKCMVCDSFTQYNENGIGVSITNNGYAQLVSIFTINCDIGIYAASGGSCDLTNSNSSFGNYGLYAVGLGRTEFTAQVGTYPPTRTQPGVDAGSDKVTFVNMSDEFANPRRPYDGQALFFKINLNNYPESKLYAQGNGVLQTPMVLVQSIKVTNGGSGYSSVNPPTVIIRDSADKSQRPKGPQGIIAEVSPTIDPISGEIIAIDVVNSGRNYLPTQNLEVFIDGTGGAAAEVITQPIYYTVDVSTPPTVNHRFADANSLIYKNIDFIATEAVDRVLDDGYSIPNASTGQLRCVEDIKLVLFSIMYNLQFGGNDRVYDAAKVYVDNPYLDGEEPQSIVAYNYARDICKQIINNVTVTKRIGILNSYTQLKDLTLIADPSPATGAPSNTNPDSCTNVKNAIDTFFAIITTAINPLSSPRLPTSRTVGNTAGITTVTFNEFIPYELFGSEEVSLKRISRILTSSHSFEYIGTGVDINTSTPFKGAVPVKENEIVALDGAQVPFTSTDQKGNFDIGEGFQINQPTATIRGRDFSKAIQAEVTPLILALR